MTVTFSIPNVCFFDGVLYPLSDRLQWHEIPIGTSVYARFSKSYSCCIYKSSPTSYRELSKITAGPYGKERNFLIDFVGPNKHIKLYLIIGGICQSPKMVAYLKRMFPGF